MKAVKVRILGKEYYLTFNGEAMFAIRDIYGGAESLLEAIRPDTRESLAALCEAVALFAEQGELARRYMGYEPGNILKADILERIIQPSDIIALKLALPRVITLGYGSEIDKNDKNEVDLGLAELNEKKTD